MTIFCNILDKSRKNGCSMLRYFTDGEIRNARAGCSMYKSKGKKFMLCKKWTKLI